MKCGIVDVGSNTMRLSIYEYSDTDFRLLLGKKETAGLAGYIEHGALTPAGVKTASRVLYGFRALLNNLEIPDLYVFGTAALRNITNTEQVLDDIGELIGLEVDVLSGAEEADLSFLGAARGGGTDTGLLADIGGGSTELVAFERGAVVSGCSLPVGSLSLYASRVEGLFPTERECRDIARYVETELELARTKGTQRKELTGVGGTIRAAVRLCNDRADQGPMNRAVSAGEMESLYQDLKRGTKDTLRQILRVAPDRVHTILPGLMILLPVIRAYGIETIHASAYGVREGYLLSRVMSGNE